MNERVALAEKMGIEIQIACNRYIPVAVRGSILYFVIADLEPRGRMKRALTHIV